FPGLLLLHTFDLCFDEFSSNDPEDLIDTFSIPRADLMAAVPTVVLTPERAASLAVQTMHHVGTICCGRRAGRSGGRHVLGHILDASFKAHHSSTWFLSDNIALGANHMYDDAVLGILFHLLHPPAHLIKTLLIDDAVD
ncbi:MAG: hypothetical protein Q9198_006601, partial [Flavoplaca austrocitrina]